VRRHPPRMPTTGEASRRGAAHEQQGKQAKEEEEEVEMIISDCQKNNNEKNEGCLLDLSAMKVGLFTPGGCQIGCMDHTGCRQSVC
jgi:ABC-type enterochelin transport system substrate-binding protein